MALPSKYVPNPARIHMEGPRCGCVSLCVGWANAEDHEEFTLCLNVCLGVPMYAKWQMRVSHIKLPCMSLSATDEDSLVNDDFVWAPGLHYIDALHPGVLTSETDGVSGRV